MNTDTSNYLKALEKDKMILDHSDEAVEKKFGTVGAVALDAERKLSSCNFNRRNDK